MKRGALKKLLKKSPWELIRFLTVEQWQAIDAEYLGASKTGNASSEGDDSAAKAGKAGKKRKGKSGKGGKGSKTVQTSASIEPAPYSLRPLIVGILVAVGLSVVVYQAELESRRLWVGWHFLGYLLPMIVVLLSHPRQRASALLDRAGGSKKTGRLLWIPIIVTVLIALSLTAQELYGERGVFARLFPDLTGKYVELTSFGWWTGWRFAGYLAFPVLVVLVLPGFRVRDMFISTKNFRRHLWIYVGLFMIVLPAVLIAAQTPSFKLTYPFYKLANRSQFDFWGWQGLYWVQFISLEFFFRGFILRVLAPRFGSTAIFVMIVPYCMIHFGKPLAETLGAIIAGLVLGTLAMRTKSIWGGAFIHIAVAVTMDSLAVADCPSSDSGLRCPSHFR